MGDKRQDNVVGDILESDTTPHKIHVRGVDDLTTQDIQQFCAENYSSQSPVRVEWIDDTSANIIYRNPATASEALESFTSRTQETDDVTLHPTKLREAKRLSSRSMSVLQVRIALSTDQKRPRAHEASRFYMLHPEHDPRERRRVDGKRRINGCNDYERKRYSDRENVRRKARDREEGFSASMYDDDGISSGRSSVEMPSGESTRDRTSTSRRRKDPYRLARERSASPEREGKNCREHRNRTPPPSYRSRDPHPFPAGNKDKELFPTKSSTHGISNAISKEGDLFSNKILAADLKKELFPQKLNTVNHRRSDAFDAADETANLFANGLSVPLKDGARDRTVSSHQLGGDGMRLDTLDRHGAFAESRLQDHENNGLVVKGASDQKGFSIRGGASATGTIKELFPGKDLGNGGKELFSEKLQSRGRRNRAEDMFH